MNHTLLIWGLFLVAGVIVIRRRKRARNGKKQSVAGQTLQGLWTAFIILSFFPALFLDLLVDDHYYFFTKRRLEEVAEWTGITQEADTDFTEFFRGFGGPDSGPHIRLTLKTSLSGAEFLKRCCKGEIKGRTEDGLYYFGENDPCPVHDVASASTDEYFRYIYAGKQFDVFVFYAEGVNEIRVRF